MNSILNQFDNEVILILVNNNMNDPYMLFNEKESLQKFCEIMAQNYTKISVGFFLTFIMQKDCKIWEQISYYYYPSPLINIYIETL